MKVKERQRLQTRHSLGLAVGVKTLLRQKSKCYRNLHQKPKLWQQQQRNPTNQLSDRYCPNLIAAGNQHSKGGVSVAKGKYQSWLLECTHYSSDWQVSSMCNGDKCILDGQYWNKPSKMDRIRNDEKKSGNSVIHFRRKVPIMPKA